MHWEEITWLPRQSPLEAEAAYASGEAAERLAAHLLGLAPEYRDGLSGVCGSDFLVLLGKSDCLPWSPGIRYLGRPIPTQPLYWPTECAPTYSEGLLARRIVQHAQAGGLQGPYALIPERVAVISLSEARHLDDRQVRTWLEAR